MGKNRLDELKAGDFVAKLSYGGSLEKCVVERTTKTRIVLANDRGSFTVSHGSLIGGSRDIWRGSTTIEPWDEESHGEALKEWREKLAIKKMVTKIRETNLISVSREKLVRICAILDEKNG